MNTLQTSSAPKPIVVLPHFAMAAIAFLILSIILFIAPETLIGHYFKPVLLAQTHIAVLGWVTMIIFGSLYQLLPVITGNALYSEKLALVTFVIFTLGIVSLVLSFWNFHTGYFFIAAGSVVFVSFTLFAYNIAQTIIKAKKLEVETHFILLSAFYLVLTGLMGVILVINFNFPVFSKSHFIYLSVHAHFGIIGWFVNLILGASSKLIPMFLISHQLNRQKLKFSFIAINAGLLFLWLNWLTLDNQVVQFITYLMIAGGFFSFGSFIFESYKKRVRKNLDTGMKHTMLSIIIIVIPIVLALLAIGRTNNSNEILQVLILYGFTILVGTITSLILGQTFKTLPFIVWLAKYQKYVGKAKSPLPKELYSEKILLWQFIVYIISLLVFIIGIIFSNILIIRIGAAFLIMTAILYNTNVFMILFHKVKIENI